MNQPANERNPLQRTEDRLAEEVEPQHRRRHAESDAPTDDPSILNAEQHRESRETVAGPAPLTGPMARGAGAGLVIGAVVGALIAAPFALIPIGDLAAGWRLVILAVVGAVAGATVGVHYLGPRASELGGESIDADNRPSAGSTLRDPGTDRRGR